VHEPSTPSPLIESIRSSSAGQIGVDRRGIWAQKEPGGRTLPENFPLSVRPLVRPSAPPPPPPPPPPPSGLFCRSHLFLPSLFFFSSRLLLLGSFLTGKPVRARCNARYRHPEGGLRSRFPRPPPFPPPRDKLQQQPRSPKFRKKGSRNNKTYRGPAALRLSTLEDEPEKERGEWRTDGGGKGDTFHCTRDTFPPGSLPHSLTCIGESERIRSHVSRAVARERLEAPSSRSRVALATIVVAQ